MTRVGRRPLRLFWRLRTVEGAKSEMLVRPMTIKSNLVIRTIAPLCVF